MFKNLLSFLSKFSRVKKKEGTVGGILGSVELDAHELRRKYPPVLRSPNKKVLFDLSMGGYPFEGNVVFTRYSEKNYPGKFSSFSSTKYIGKNSYYDYERDGLGGFHWHVNFADENLFGFYGYDLFAQDEIMAAEMPILASLREYLVKNGKDGLRPKTAERFLVTDATPCLIRNVQRRLNIDTRGIYGNDFRVTPSYIIKEKTDVVDPPTMENIIAMESPKYGRGRVDKKTIEFMLRTAYTSFSAAVTESQIDEESSVVIHSGGWGTGAYGMNKELSALVQICAANLSGVDVLVYHSLELEYFERALEVFEVFSENDLSVDSFIHHVLETKRYMWGVSNNT